MLELENVCVRYGDVSALEDISLSIEPGALLAVIGPNGSGKSTLLRAACGLLPLFSGGIRADGEALTALTPKQIAQRVSYLPQSRSVPDITAERMVLHGRFPHLGYPRHLRNIDREIAARSLEVVGGEALSHRSLRELSGGQRQRVYVAMALAQETGTLLLDEPTTYLDIAYQYQTARLLRRLAGQGKAVAAVMHDLPMAFRTADRIVVLDKGRIVVRGAPEEVFQSGVIPAVLGVSMERIDTPSGMRYFCGEVV